MLLLKIGLQFVEAHPGAHLLLRKSAIVLLGSITTRAISAATRLLSRPTHRPDKFDANQLGFDVLHELSEPDLEKARSVARNRKQLLKAQAKRANQYYQRHEKPANRGKRSVVKSRCCSATWPVRLRCRGRSIRAAGDLLRR
jgi:hypothetical protein